MDIHAIIVADFHHGAVDVNTYKHELFTWFLPSLAEQLQNKPNYLVLAGDYFNHKMEMTSNASKLAIQCFAEIVRMCWGNGCPIYMVQGTWSHDYDQIQLLWNMSMCLKFPGTDTPVVHYISQSVQVLEPVPGYSVLFIPEMYPINHEEYRNHLLSLASHNIQAVHFHGRWDFCAFREELMQSERGMRGAPVHNTDDFMTFVKGPITGGHIHTGDSNGKVFYTSSLTRWSFGEPEPKGYLTTIHTKDTDKFTVSRIINPVCTEYHTIVAPQGSEESAIMQARDLRARGCKVKIKVDNPVSLQVLRHAMTNDTGIKVDAKGCDAGQLNVINDHDMQLSQIFSNPDPVQVIIAYEQFTSGNDQPLSYDFVAQNIHKT
jgi:DNA repair exonuclease SbcCD nuclease subunit